MRWFYTSTGHPAIYEMISVLFDNRYLTVMAEEPEEVKSHMLWHLQELMEDAIAYGWMCVRLYQAARLQQLGLGRATCSDELKKNKL